MKIAHVTATFPPYWAGTGNVAYNQAKILHKMGHHVEVFTALPKNSAPLQFDFAVHYLPTLGRIGNAPFTPGLVRHLKGFDVIHLHYPYIFGAELSMLASTLYKTPIVIMYHNDLIGQGIKQFLFTLYTRILQPTTLRSANVVLATTQDYATHSLLKKVGSLNINIVQNAIDASILDRSANIGPSPIATVPYVLFVGAMDPAHHFKGIPVIIDASTQLKRREVKIILAGDGPSRVEYETYAYKIQATNVEFVGRVSQNNLLNLYHHASATVLPSTTQGEAFGLVLLESWANETPVIASDLPGVRSLVSDGIDGYLSPPGDSLALANAIDMIINNPEASKVMGYNGYQKVTKFYSWDYVGTLLESTYEKVLGGYYNSPSQNGGAG